MELFIGGFGQNKYETVKALYPNVKDDNIWNHIHLDVKKWLEEGQTLEEVRDRIWKRISDNPGILIISDEIGNGIVPMDDFQRMYREEMGRILIDLAKEAKHVTRIMCGIPQQIK